MTDKHQKKADELRATTHLARNATHLAIEHTIAELAAGKSRDPAGAARNLAVVMGVASDKLVQSAPCPRGRWSA